jgi:hypothetical protein
MDGSASIGLEQALLGHSLGFAPMASPTQVYVALCLAAQPPSETVRGLEASGGGYVRTPATFALISGPSNIAANTTSVEFQQATSSWGVVGFFELWDAASGGNRLYWGQLVDPADFTTPLTITVSAGDIVRFSAGTLGVQAATGSGGTASIGAYLPLAGGTLTGPVYLAGDPTDTLQAATKQYVDAHSGSGGGPGFLPLSGGTMLGPLTLGPSLIWGAITATGFGTAIGQVPVFVNSQGSGFPGLNLSGRTILRRSTTTETDYADIQISRTTTFNAGTPGTAANNAALRVLGTYGLGNKTNEWNIISTAITSGTGGGTISGAFLQGIRAAGAKDPVWGAITNAIDQNDTDSLTSGAQLIPLEIDVVANRADNAVNTQTVGGVGVRKVLDIVAVRQTLADTTQFEVSHGIWFTAGTYGSTSADAYTNYQSAIGFGVNTQIRNALDTRGAITPTGSSNPVSAVTMTAGHIVDFNGGPALNSAPGAYLRYDSATSKLIYYVSGVAKWSVDASGNMRCAGTVTPSVTP